MTQNLNPQSTFGRMRERERPYANFARHVQPDDSDAPQSEVPLDPHTRVVADTIAALSGMIDMLATLQRDVLVHTPSSVRLKLSRLLLSAGTQTENALHVFSGYQLNGSLKAARKAPAGGKRPAKADT